MHLPVAQVNESKQQPQPDAQQNQQAQPDAQPKQQPQTDVQPNQQPKRDVQANQQPQPTAQANLAYPDIFVSRLFQAEILLISYYQKKKCISNKHESIDSLFLCCCLLTNFIQISRGQYRRNDDFELNEIDLVY